MIYDKIYDFCKVRNNGNCFENGSEPTPRVKFILDLLDKEGIEYELDVFEGERYSWRAPKRRERNKRKPKLDRRWFSRFLDEEELDELDDMDLDDLDLDDLDFDFLDENVDTNPEPEPTEPVNKYFNIIMKGTSNKMIIAHHDVNNHTIDNANDNSCSVINVIATKKLRPDVNAVLVDGEEFGGIGSKRLGKLINEGRFGSIEWVLNYELTGKGGENFFIGNYPGKLFNHIKSLFNCPVVNTPFNDAVTLRGLGIDSVVINPVPPLPEGKKSDVVYNGVCLDTSILHHCHNAKDNVDSISTSDMKDFVEKVVLEILK